MRVLHHFLVLALVCTLFNQCQKELKYTGTGSAIAATQTDPHRANLQGNIVDENNRPAENAVVKVGSQTTTTNSQGYFRINNAEVDKNATLVTVEKSGYFTTYRSFGATSGTNQVVIKLTKKNL